MDVNGIQYVKKMILHPIVSCFERYQQPVSPSFHVNFRSESYHIVPPSTHNVQKCEKKQTGKKKSWQADKNNDDDPNEFWIYPTLRETQKRIRGKSQLCLWAPEANPASVAFQCAANSSLASKALCKARFRICVFPMLGQPCEQSQFKIPQRKL